MCFDNRDKTGYSSPKNGTIATSGLTAVEAVLAIARRGPTTRWFASSLEFERDGQPVPIYLQEPITLAEASVARMAALEGTGFGFFMEADVRADRRVVALGT